jgi:hypothetical protein
MSVSSGLASIPAFDNNGVDPAQASLNRLQQVIGLLDNTLRLPNTPRAFAVYLLGLIIVFAGAFLHVLVAAQIMQAEFTLGQLKEEFSAIEQQNGDIIFKIARDTNMARLHQRVLEEGYVPVQEREYIFVPSATLAEAATLAQGISVNDTATTALAATATQPAAAVAPQANEGGANKDGGQFALWEEFWAMTWRAAFGRSELPSTPNVTSNLTTNVAASAAPKSVANDAQPTVAQPATTSPNFWSVWWEQASDQGSKLLEQFRSQ